eukprot:8448043-Pyramimonas_sp.AAC.1
MVEDVGTRSQSVPSGNMHMIFREKVPAVQFATDHVGDLVGLSASGFDGASRSLSAPRAPAHSDPHPSER